MVWYPAVGIERLFDLETDPQEINDLAKKPEHANKLEELRAALIDLGNELGDSNKLQ